MERKFNFSPTCIGSFPHTDPRQICDKILNSFTEIPFWPQLPKRSFFENMYAQYSEGLPGVQIDDKNKTIYLEASKNLSSEIERTYEKYLAGDLEYFAITKERAAGFYEFTRQLEARKTDGLKFIKGHVTGPVSFGLAITDESKQAIFYNQELQEVLTKVLAMKIRWQVRKLKSIFDKVIIFIDEPYMVSIGSSYVNIKPDEAMKRIEELVKEVHKEGGLAGIHCCGNTDWGLLLRTDIDIINFDAYNFIESISLYPEELKQFLALNKSIAWGIVPTSSDAKEDAGSLLERLEKGFDVLAKKGVARKDLLRSSLITPSCGCGTLSIDKSEEILSLTLKISERLRK